jgi:hypothetical protein
MRNGLLERAGGSLRRSCLTVAALIYLTAFVGEAWAGAFTFSNETDRRDVVTHPKGYNGSGGNLVVTVCVNPASAHATAMVISTQNAVNTWNGLIATSPNLLSGTSNNIPAGQMDFESTLLHELGHCIGLNHPNLATESGVAIADENYTQSTDGNHNGVNNPADFNLGMGADGVRGSSDDVRGDDFNLHFFRKSNNNPFTIGPLIDRTTYSQDLVDLPVGHTYAANADRSVGAMLGVPDTEAVMQQGAFADEDQRKLNHDDVASIKYAMTGWDELQVLPTTTPSRSAMSD